MVHGVTYPTNPARHVDPWARAMVSLYYRCGNGMGGLLMPEEGGPLNQLALNMQAFAVVGAIEAEYREASGGDEG